MLVSHTFVADKMDKDRPGLPAPDDNIEEVPSTSGVQERASEGDWENVLIEISDSSSEEEAEDAHLEPSQRGKKRKRVDDDAGGSAPAQHVPPPSAGSPWSRSHSLQVSARFKKVYSSNWSRSYGELPYGPGV